MKSIILAAGYATRLYPITENYPKPLLEVGGITILDRLIRDIDTFDEIDSHLIVSNNKFFPQFEKWSSKNRYSKKISIINDGSTENENRLGAVQDLLLAIEISQSKDDLLVLAADNVVDFSFRGFIDYFIDKQTSMIMTYHEQELSALKRTGVITMNKDNVVYEMQEKPANPKSHFAVPPFYIYKKDDITFMQTCMDEGCNIDAPGNLVRFMLNKTVFHAWPMTGKRYDIGTLETYNNLKDLLIINR